MTVTRRDLVEAQVAIFKNQDREQRAGVYEETEEYLRLHHAYYDLADQVPWWRRIGVWGAACAEHDRTLTYPPSPQLPELMCPPCCADRDMTQPNGAPGAAYRCPGCDVEWSPAARGWTVWEIVALVVVIVLVGAVVRPVVADWPTWAALAASAVLAVVTVTTVAGVFRLVRGAA